MTGPDRLLSVEEAHARLMRLFAPVGTEEVPLAEAAGRVLARDVVATRAQPPFDASAMDGYAIRASDAATAARLRVVGVSAAGRRFTGAVGRGEAVRIFTGAPVPEGADRIVIQEDAELEGETIVLRDDRGRAAHIRPAGGDFEAGARVAAPRRLGPADIALIAAMNVAGVSVARRPVVALIPTGDELVFPGDAPGPDQIVSCNNFALKAMLEAAGAAARLLPVARDTAASLVAVLDLAAGADLIVTLGGASVGDFDLVQGTAIQHGLALDFYKIAMRPGKPLMAGRLGAVPLVGLPGNPVSAIVCGHLFLRPAVAVMLGLRGDPPPRHQARLAVEVAANGPRTHFMRAQIEPGKGGWDCTPFERQDSSLVSVLAQADGLAIRPPLVPPGSVGDRIEFVWLSATLD